ncbi:MAG: ABC transporter permease [Oscillospiraceae bacterium]
MLAYIVKRVASLVPVLVVVSLAIFLIIHITPGDPAATILGLDATGEEIAALNEQMGFNRPLYQQYFSWVANALRGNLGDSIFMKQPVTEAIAEHMGPTFTLAVLAQAIALVLSVPLGIVSAYKKDTLVDGGITGLSLLGMAVPSFLMGMFLMLLFGVQLQWVQVAGYKPLSAGLWEHIKYLILPSVALGMVQAALITRITRSAMAEVLQANFIRTIRAKGMKKGNLLIKHAFRNAALPVLTVIGQTFGTLITGAVVVESLFNIPGLGQLIINAITRRDFAVIQGVVLFVTVLYIGVNLVVDLLYGVIDPRVNLSGKP